MSQFIVFNSSGGGGSNVLTLTGNSGGAITPVAGNINVVGDGVTLSTSKNGAGTLLVSIDGESANTVTTNNATPTTIATFSLASTGEAVTVTATIIGTKSDFSAACGGTAFVVARRQPAMAAAPLIVANVSANEDSTTGAPTFQVVLSGNDVLFQVVGEAATVYNWKALLRFTNLT